MTDDSRPSLGQLYSQHAAPPRPPQAPESGASLGALYAEWIGEDSGYLPVADPEVVAARRAQLEADAAAGSGVPTDAATGAAGPDAGTAIPGQEQSAGGGIGRASAIMAAGTLVSRMLGFVRTILLGALILDTVGNVWTTANQLPNAIYLLLAGGVINAVLVPQITRALTHKDGGQAYTDRLLTLAMTILLGATIVFTAASPLVFKIGYVASSGDTFKLGVVFTLICMPQLFFYGLYTLFGEVLNARSRFGALMWAPALANIFAIAGIVWLLVTADHRPVRDPGDWTTTQTLILAGSATLGIVAQALVLIVPLRRSGYRWRPNFTFRGVGLRATSKIAGWASAAVVVQQIGVQIVNNNVLNSQPTANQAQSYAFLFFMLPHSLVTLSLITALFTRMSRAAHAGSTRAVTEDARLSLRLSSVATIAATFGALVAAGPLAHFFYGAELGTAVERQTIAMMLGIVPFTVIVVVQRVFFAYEDARTPFVMQVVCTIVTAIFAIPSLLLPGAWVGVGVALAGSIAYVVEAYFGFRWLRQRRLPRLHIVDVMQTWVRLAVSGVLALVVAFAVRYALSFVLGDSTRTANLVILVGAAVSFMALYVVIARRLHVREVEELVSVVLSKLGGVRRLVSR
ncbi:murein biosynthesis integral membrane protein MurJ [Flexivirga sp. ID2601S]|uniref:Murein biosynthesis integral membrane protein MurJ n=1 Tax=Flexivirga aerilata TaxID=1656889 RepID=A0A849AGP9_9MICO|nr:murein biosynthesis integral membrane protein MurJ [Flexivirga aerilata]NNG38451.1 murein biosynthesis integral membrane protein MurJ [Flexivirga aerilata]